MCALYVNTQPVEQFHRLTIVEFIIKLNTNLWGASLCWSRIQNQSHVNRTYQGDKTCFKHVFFRLDV